MQHQTTFIIEDEFHAEQQGEFKTYKDAFRELQQRVNIPWNEIPNRCPCTNWENCERNYQIIEYDTTQTPWKELKRKDVLTISAKGTKWTTDK